MGRKRSSGPSGGKASGNFIDLDCLFEQLARPPVFELGNPLPRERFLPRPRVGASPAAHNIALLGDELKERRASKRREAALKKERPARASA